ncbi:uncharacterized protein LOC141853074 isoform X2 [Brevipalpus obovatus]|uniref:uncharacterized protein LOC141853074 isoform X2 n=1 Tax=Brevipalpus obovatus TaxID=246614 RepID=UPI003D9F00E6
MADYNVVVVGGMSKSALSRMLEIERLHRQKVDELVMRVLEMVKSYYEGRLADMEASMDQRYAENLRDLNTTKFDLRMAQSDLQKQKNLCALYRDLRKEAEVEIKSLKENLSKQEQGIETLKKECETIRTNFDESEKSKTEYEKKLKNLQQETEKLNEVNEKLKKGNECLRDMCKKVESQVQKFQNLYQGQNDALAKMAQEKQLKVERVGKLEDELKSIQQHCNEQILKMSKIIESLEKESDSYKSRCAQLSEELKTVQTDLNQERQFRLLHEDEVPKLMREDELKQQTIVTLQTKLAKCEDDIFLLKEETSRHITNHNALLSQNKKLTQSLEDALTKNSTLHERLEVTLGDMENKTSEFVKEKMKLNETINQQLKLIDMLQEKMEKPKKNWFGLNSPKSHHSPSTPSIHLREIEAALERERAKNKSLVQQIDETKKELRQLKKYERQSKSHRQGIIDSETDDSEYHRQLEAEVEAMSSSGSAPSAPPKDFETLSSTSSAATTDNNVDTSEEEKEYTFSDSMLEELGDRKVSNIDFVKDK